MNANPTLILFLILTKNFFLQSNALLDLNLIENYFAEKSIKSATVFGCFSKTEHKITAKVLSGHTSPIAVLNLNQDRIHDNIQTNHQQIGVVLDGDCPQSHNFLITSGERKLFDVKHHWLIVSNSLNIFKKFKNVILNINADIHVAIRNNNNWTIFDVYNPASEHGGVLKYSRMGYYKTGQGYNARTREAKYWARKNMTGITFKTMVVLLVPFQGTLQDYLHNDDNRTINTFNRFQNKLLRFCRDYYNYTVL